MKLTITTKEGNFFNDEIKFVTFKTIEGEVGIFPNHTPFTSVLVPGVIAIDTIDGKRLLAVSVDGYVVVDKSKIIMLTDKVLWEEELASTDVKVLEEVLSERKIAKYESKKNFVINKAEIERRANELKK